MFKKYLLLLSLISAFTLTTVAQNRFEGYNVVVEAPKDHTKSTCAVRFVPPATNITISDMNSATPLRLSSCGGSSSSLVQNGSNAASVKASPSDYKWCFQGEDKWYKVTVNGDKYTPSVTYVVAAQADERTRGFYNIRDFGAVGDGKTDDTASFKGAMAAIASNNGGTLTIPDGDYLITSPVTVPSGTIIQGTNGLHSMASTSDLTRKNPSRIRLKGSNTALFRIGECTEHVTVRDIELIADSNVGTNGIEAFGAWVSSQGFNFERVTFQGFDRAIHAYALPQTDLNWQFDYIKISECRFIYNRDAGIWVNSRNTDWRIEGTVFINPKKQPGQNANSMHFERVGGVVIQDTFGGGYTNALGGTFINILDSGPTTIIGSQTEAMTASIVVNAVENPNAGDYSHPITVVNSVFGDPIIFKARRTYVSTGTRYDGKTFTADERLRVYSTGDRFCFDGYILGCQNAAKNNFDKATVIFMTGQPTDGSVPGHPTLFGTDVKFDKPVQLPIMPVNTLPQRSQNGSFLYCSDCQRNATPCRGGGTGAPAMYVGDKWSCL